MTAEAVPMTLADLAGYLHPPVSENQLSRIIGQLPGLRPVGLAPSTGGRPARVFDAAEVMELHNCLRKWLAS